MKGEKRYAAQPIIIDCSVLVGIIVGLKSGMLFHGSRKITFSLMKNFLNYCDIQTRDGSPSWT